MRDCYKLIFLAVSLFFASSSLAQIPANYQVIADYPLSSDLADITGTYGDFNVGNAPFQDGGIYFNGIFGGTNGSFGQSVEITGLDLDALIFSFDFKILEAVPTGIEMPIFIGGLSWRWLGVFANDQGQVYFKHSNTSFPSTGNAPIVPDVFYNVIVTYDQVSGLAKMYMDNVEVASEAVTLVHGNDKQFSVTDGSVGTILKGVIRNVRIYAINMSTDTEDDVLPSAVTLAQNYPNPFNPTTEITFSLAKTENVRLAVFDHLGREVAVLRDAQTVSGDHSVAFDASGLPSGVYFYRLDTASTSLTKTLTLLK